jgi:hypothetical protein
MSALTFPHPRRPQPAAHPADAAKDGAQHVRSRRWAIMTVLCAVAFTGQLDFLIVNVTLNGIGASFAGASDASLSWVLSACMHGICRPPPALAAASLLALRKDR